MRQCVQQNNKMNQKVEISTQTQFVPQQSDSKNKRYVFAYTVTITNKSDRTCQLMSRHWVIQDANQKIEEVYGEGVIGEQPVIKPGESYQYTSGAVLETEMGTMEGRYFMLSSDNEFEVPIPRFVLSVPRILH